MPSRCCAELCLGAGGPHRPGVPCDAGRRGRQRTGSALAPRARPEPSKWQYKVLSFRGHSIHRPQPGSIGPGAQFTSPRAKLMALGASPSQVVRSHVRLAAPGRRGCSLGGLSAFSRSAAAPAAVRGEARRRQREWGAPIRDDASLAPAARPRLLRPSTQLLSPLTSLRASPHGGLENIGCGSALGRTPASLPAAPSSAGPRETLDSSSATRARRAVVSASSSPALAGSIELRSRAACLADCWRSRRSCASRRCCSGRCSGWGGGGGSSAAGAGRGATCS